MRMDVGRGLKAVAKKAFEQKLYAISHPTKNLVEYTIKDGKVNGIHLGVVTTAIINAGNHFQQTATILRVARHH